MKDIKIDVLGVILEIVQSIQYNGKRFNERYLHHYFSHLLQEKYHLLNLTENIWEITFHPEWPTYKQQTGLNFGRYKRKNNKYQPAPSGTAGFIDFAIGNYDSPDIGIEFSLKYGWSKEEIVFEDLSETKSASTSLYLDMNENYPDVKEFEDVKECRIKVQNGTLTDLDMPKRVENLLNQYSGLSDEDLDKKIAEGHNYRFIGKTGSFCPVKAGCNGGLLVREKDGKYFAVTGTKGYRWLESETVQMLKKEVDIDMSYYDCLVDDAIKTISEYGDFEWFVNV